MGKLRTIIRGAAVGAGLMYLFDPERGRRRRARLRDQAVHLNRELVDMVDTAQRDFKHRAEGMVARVRSTFESGAADDRVVQARVRAELGRLVSHPGAIHVEARDGVVTLTGPILRKEVRDLLSGVESVRGVRSVISHLEPHDSAENVPSLQGGRQRPGRRPELLQSNWAPAPRMIVGGIAGLLTLKGLRRGGLLGRAYTVTGLGLLARSVTNLELRRLTGLGAGRRAVDVRKTVHVRAPVGEVFEFWQNFENFPKFMSHVREVRRTGDDRAHWVTEGPGGITVEWDAEVTALIPNEVIAWKSIGDSPIGHAGIVRFQPEGDGTRIDIQMSYNPPAGALGHALASVLGADPKHMMDEDMVRLQSLLEKGKTTAHGHEVTRQELQQPIM